MSYLKEQWNQDKLRCALVVCWLLTVATSFFNSYLFPIEVPGVGTWYAFRTMLPLTALLYVIYAVRTKRFFWKDSTTLEKWCYVFIAVMLLYGAASLPRALDVSWTFRKLFNLCFDMCFFFLLLRLCRQKKIRKLTLTVCFAVWVTVMVLGVYEVFNGGIVDSAYDGANWKTFTWFLSSFQLPVVFSGNTNDYALLLVFFYEVFLLTTWREAHVPRWLTFVLTAVTYFLLLATGSRLNIFAFFIILVTQIMCAILKHQKAARRNAVWMILCVMCIQFCNQYQYIVPPIQKYLDQQAAYTQAVKEAEKNSHQEDDKQVQGNETQENETSGEQSETTAEIKKPELQIGDPQKESLHDQLFEINDAGEEVLRNSGSAGVRTRLLIHAFRCFTGSYGLGVGLGNTEIAARDYANIQDGKIWSIHCFIARIIGDYGIFILIPLCAIGFLLLKSSLTTLLTALKRKDWQTAAYALLFFAVLLTYPIVSTASSDAQDSIAMWIYLAVVVTYAAQGLETEGKFLTEEMDSLA